MSKLSNTEKLFLEVYNYNWDKGLNRLKKILNNKDCDKATALMIYWRANPGFYNQFDEIPKEYNIEFKFIKQIEEKVLSNLYPEIIRYNLEAEKELIPKDLGRIPEEMCMPSNGSIDANDLINKQKDGLLLIQACRDGNEELVEHLLKNGYDINEKINGEYPIQSAINYSRNSEFVQYLIDNGANIKVKDAANCGYTLLHYATQKADCKLIELLLDAGLDVDFKGKWKRTPLHTICFWDDMDTWKQFNYNAVVNLLIVKGANLDAKDADGYTPLDLAIKSGNTFAEEILNQESLSLS